MDGMDTAALDPILQARFAGIDRLYGAGSLARLAGSRVAVVGWAESARGWSRRWCAAASAIWR